ncbi:MAG TPA: thioredoxin family protein [Chitinophagaceae bacterium]|nr:thioredoxin family protein [Chitinophagaceae bacterium]HMX77324.1 thioredoxin family protein [Chitinophagaceae bacterium]HNA91517.1 thioredoxin family protein [Chitinophagaceae bacterium]HNC37733.1 thioredoxin family protein [Chitinophagaceae bacterium]HNK60097.1 thioredoxin family protein [Chitinophagaceae bacterium]
MRNSIYKIAPVFILTLLLATQLTAQSQYEVLIEQPNEKTLKGIISREVLLADTSFHWYAENQKGYKPNEAALAGLQKQKDSIQLLVFMGTWCEDSHFVIPKFFALTDAAGFPQNRITLIGVDRNKKTLSHLSEALNVDKVPTIIVMKHGKEMGRVVEYGKFGLYDLDLGEILKAIQ